MQAAPRAATEKSSSLIDARQTPPITGISEPLRRGHRLAVQRDAEDGGERGSDALTICANETAPRFIEKIDMMCAPAAHAATNDVLHVVERDVRRLAQIGMIHT